MSLAVFGGTFDPVHFGHLRSAVEVREALQLDRVKLIPAFHPPHRELPGTPAEHRLAMLELATAEAAHIEVDDIEYQLEGKSYTFNTLTALRSSLGDDECIVLVLGADAFVELHTWYKWQSLLSLCHLLVIDRPGHALALPEEMVTWNQQHQLPTTEVTASPAGGICHLSLTQLDISATQIRHLLAAGRSVEYLLPPAVEQYIRTNGLYTQAHEQRD